MSELNQIWLAPTCHEDGDGRLWCQDDVWGDDCGCGIEQHSAVRYVIASAYDRDTQALKDELDNIKRSWGLILSQRDALAAERSWAETELPKWRGLAKETRIERDELRVQVEAMRDDAERYQWIRASFVRTHNHSLTWYLPWTSPLTANGLDANVDNARRTKP